MTMFYIHVSFNKSNNKLHSKYAKLIILLDISTKTNVSEGWLFHCNVDPTFPNFICLPGIVLVDMTMFYIHVSFNKSNNKLHSKYAKLIILLDISTKTNVSEGWLFHCNVDPTFPTKKPWYIICELHYHGALTCVCVIAGLCKSRVLSCIWFYAIDI